MQTRHRPLASPDDSNVGGLGEVTPLGLPRTVLILKPQVPHPRKSLVLCKLTQLVTIDGPLFKKHCR